MKPSSDIAAATIAVSIGQPCFAFGQLLVEPPNRLRALSEPEAGQRVRSQLGKAA
jgi:hypothetical protein